MVYSLLLKSLVAEGVQTRSVPAWKETLVTGKKISLFSLAASKPLRSLLFWKKTANCSGWRIQTFVFIFSNVISFIVAFDKCQMSSNFVFPPLT